MSLLGGIMKSLINPASLMQLAMGPAGWASLAMKTIGTAIAQQVIQQLGQQLGLPQSMISLAQTAFGQASGTQGFPTSIKDAVAQLAEQFNLSPMEQGQLQRSAENDANNMFQKLSDAFKSGKDMAEARKSSRGKGSWLQKIADSMAKVLDAKIQDMDKQAQALDKQGSNKSVKASTDLQVAGQEFSYLMGASSTVIKTIGEGLSSMARKQ
jgi:biopolymer transport protein ExbB/TolQ